MKLSMQLLKNMMTTKKCKLASKKESGNSKYSKRLSDEGFGLSRNSDSNNPYQGMPASSDSTDRRSRPRKGDSGSRPKFVDISFPRYESLRS